jgi:hypothetical protein
MRKRSKNLRPDDGKVADAAEANVGKGAVEDVTDQMAKHSGNDGFATTVATQSNDQYCNDDQRDWRPY